MERLIVIAGLEEQASNGGILAGHKDRQRATDTYRAAVTIYSEARRNLIETVFPRHYRVAIMGSARLDESTPEYAFIKDLSYALVTKTGCDIVTGGGPGIMEAAAQGGLLARRDAEKKGRIVNSRNVGVRIEVPFEEKLSPSLDQHSLHSGFSTRIDELYISHAVYFGPGGVGTELELDTCLQAKQVEHLEKNFQMIIHPSWRRKLDEMRERMYDRRVREGLRPLANESDFSQLVITDDIPHIVDIIDKSNALWKVNFHSKVKREEQGKLF